MNKIFADTCILNGSNSCPPTNGGNPGTPVVIQNPLNGINNLPDLITQILTHVVMPVASVFVVVMIIYSGFKFITAQGNPSALKEARMGLIWTLIGAVVLLGAAGIAAAVKGTICGSLITC